MLLSRIAELRKQMGLSQKELGKELRVYEKTIRNWESGDSYPSIPNLIRLCELFGVSADDLLGLHGSATISLEGLSREDQKRLIAMIQVYINLSRNPPRNKDN